MADSKYCVDRAESKYAGSQRDDAEPAKVPQGHQLQRQILRLRSIPGSDYHDEAEENTKYLAKYIQVAHQNYVMQLLWLLVTCRVIG